MEEEHADLQIGALVTWRGRLWVLRGIDPMSVAERRAELEDRVSGERLQAPLEELSPAPDAVG
ncbi:MAG TPA: hypothetical protein VNP93_06175 [Gaiellaceae bacterium]|nr:hypothetical protein [Gaiellaceae bacterium]